MFAFADETGNTGANLFDQAQPDFYTGALVTRSNFDVVLGSKFSAICKRAGIEALHASVLGVARLDTVAEPLLALLKKADARFFISRVEKRYLLATKLFDTFFDSGENPAVSWHIYNIRLLRLTLCFKVATLLTDDIAKRFWDMLMAKSEKTARAIIPEICTAMLARVPLLTDQRSRDVVTETFSWSLAHPHALDIFIASRQAKNGHMPNVVAFTNLLDGLEKLSKKWNRPLRKLVHDRQSQFEATLAEWHRLLSNASDEPIKRIDETVVFQKVAGSTFEVSASDASAGIQVADLVLWLYRQAEGQKPLSEPLVDLLRFALNRAYFSDFSFDGVAKQIEAQWRQVMASDFSPDAQARAAEMLHHQEESRRQSIAQYEADGLMPYERAHPKKIS